MFLILWAHQNKLLFNNLFFVFNLGSSQQSVISPQRPQEYVENKTRKTMQNIQFKRAKWTKERATQ